LGNLFAGGQPVFYVQLNGILDVLDSFFVRAALAVATLERGAGNEKAIGVRFDDDGKSYVLHDLSHYRSVLGHGKTDFVEGCEKGCSTHGKSKRRDERDPVGANATGLEAELSFDVTLQ